MNKEQANARLIAIEKEVKQLKKIVNETEDKSKEMSDFLFEIWNSVNGVKITGEKETTYYKDSKWLFQQDYKNEKLYISYDRIWKVFESKYKLNYEQIRSFVQGWIETNLGWNGLIPVKWNAIYNACDRNEPRMEWVNTGN